MLPCDFLPVEEEDEQKGKKRNRPNTEKRNKRQREQKERDPDSSSEDESNWRFITTLPAEPLNQSRSQLRVEAEEFQPQRADTEPEQCGEEVECPDRGEEDRMQPEMENGEMEEDRSKQMSSSDEAAERGPKPQAAPPRRYPLRQRNPPRTFTYNSLGQPSVTHRHR